MSLNACVNYRSGFAGDTSSTVRNILKGAGLDPCPKRAGTTWDEVLVRHAASLWQCDFFSQIVLTVKGVREVFVLALLHVQTRRVILTPATKNPDEVWVKQQAAAFVERARTQGLRVRYVQRDRDGKYAGFDAALKRQRVKAIKGPVAAPNCRAFIERFNGSVRRECTDHFLFFGLTHLDSVLKTWLAYYLKKRPHQGFENELLVKPKKSGRPKIQVADETIALADIRCEQQLGGLLRSYSRNAA